MDNTKHTPGPWIIRDPMGSKENELAIMAHGIGARIWIASVWDDRTPDGCDMSDANARLIAAAPEMYEALKAFKATFPTTLAGLRDFSVVDLRDALKLANQAIARVEGDL